MHGYPTDLLCDSTSRGCPWLTTSPPLPTPDNACANWMLTLYKIDVLVIMRRSGGRVGGGKISLNLHLFIKLPKIRFRSPPLPRKTQITFGPTCKNFWIHTPHMSNGLILWKVQHSFRWTETLHMFKQEITKFFPNIATYIFFWLHVGFLFYEA